MVPTASHHPPGRWVAIWSSDHDDLSQGEILFLLCFIQTSNCGFQVSVSDFLTLFSCRTGEEFFFVRMPSMVLLIAACIALLTSSLIAAFLPQGTLDDQAIEGLGVFFLHLSHRNG